MKPIKCLYYDNIIKGYHLYIIYITEYMYSVTYTIAKALIEERKTNKVKLLFEVDGEKAKPKKIKEQATSILRILLEKGTF